MQELLEIYHPELPDFLGPFLAVSEMQRLKYVGMNCGCEYTNFPLFRDIGHYSRKQHSTGTALIVWHFTGSKHETLAALFHDIATPVFAHVVDFLRGDYLTQEATESGTGDIIRGSCEIMRMLNTLQIDVSHVENYHHYPIADNESPRLSADRLEYTFGNLLNYGFLPLKDLKKIYEKLCVSVTEDGRQELVFLDAETAETFGKAALRCSRVYVSDEDRYAMQMLAELLRDAIAGGVLTDEDLSATEPEVIQKLTADPRFRARWGQYCALNVMCDPNGKSAAQRRVIPAKKRYIDPYVMGKGRLSQISRTFYEEMEDFLAESFDREICGE